MIDFFYTNQKRAWFDRKVTSWWVQNVFVPFYRSRFGERDCILLLDNCSAHNEIVQDIAEDFPWIHIWFFPPNLTSRHQPADQGIIRALKMRYKGTMLEVLLDLFDDEEKLERAKVRGRMARAGMKGLEHGEKPRVFDAIELCSAT